MWYCHGHQTPICLQCPKWCQPHFLFQHCTQNILVTMSSPWWGPYSSTTRHPPLDHSLFFQSIRTSTIHMGMPHLCHPCWLCLWLRIWLVWLPIWLVIRLRFTLGCFLMIHKRDNKMHLYNIIPCLFCVPSMRKGCQLNFIVIIFASICTLSD